MRRGVCRWLCALLGVAVLCIFFVFHRSAQHGEDIQAAQAAQAAPSVVSAESHRAAFAGSALAATAATSAVSTTAGAGGRAVAAPPSWRGVLAPQHVAGMDVLTGVLGAAGPVRALLLLAHGCNNDATTWAAAPVERQALHLLAARLRELETSVYAVAPSAESVASSGCERR